MGSQDQQALAAAQPSAANLDGLRILVQQSKAGQLTLDPDVKAGCAAACANLHTALQGIYDTMQSMDHSIALGGFDCGNTLVKALRELVTGDGGVLQRLKEHILAVGLIHDMVDSNVNTLLTKDADLALSVNTAANKG